MSKAPTVSELVGNSNVTFKPVIGSYADDKTRPDFDTDVLWKQKRVNQKQRTMSVGSSDSEGLSTSMPHVDVPRPRRLSISEMIFGSPTGRFGWGQSSLQGSPVDERRGSITEELIKHQNKILGDG
uniref:Microtubule-associated protein Jupiter n=1 Tax=Angiostrongylus cantonensis TaxID=6313 RepID=A0A0K0CZA9_ANGCA